MRATNVGGTRWLLRLAASGRRLVPFHHVSTISVSETGERSERDLFDAAQIARSQGYVASKCVAELEVRAAVAGGLPATIHRPSMVTGDSRSGASNTADFISRYLPSCLVLGCHMDEPGTCDMTPVDWVARSILALARQPSSLGRTFHLTNLARSPSFALIGRVIGSALGRPSTPLPHDAFCARLRAASDGAAVPLTPIADYVPYGMGPWRADATFAALPHADGASVDAPLCGRSVEELVGLYLRWHLAQMESHMHDDDDDDCSSEESL